MRKENLLAALRSKLAEQPQSSEADLRGGFNVIPGGVTSTQNNDSFCENNTDCEINGTCNSNRACNNNEACIGNVSCKTNSVCHNQNLTCKVPTHATQTLSDDILSFGNSL